MHLPVFLLLLVFLLPRLPLAAKLLETLLSICTINRSQSGFIYHSTSTPSPLVNITSVQDHVEILDGERERVCLICKGRLGKTDFNFGGLLECLNIIATDGSTEDLSNSYQRVRTSQFWTTMTYSFLSIQSNQVRHHPTETEYQAVETKMSYWK